MRLEVERPNPDLLKVRKLGPNDTDSLFHSVLDEVARGRIDVTAKLGSKLPCNRSNFAIHGSMGGVNNCTYRTLKQ